MYELHVFFADQTKNN